MSIQSLIKDMKKEISSLEKELKEIEIEKEIKTKKIKQLKKALESYENIRNRSSR